MNKIAQLFSNLTNEEVIQAIAEIREDEPQGIIRSEGMVRKLTAQWAELTQDNNVASNLTYVQMSLFREAAFRFTKSIEQSEQTKTTFEYQGTLIRKTHQTIYVNSCRECTQEELQSWMSAMAEDECDEYEPENGIQLSLGSEYHSEQTAVAD